MRAAAFICMIIGLLVTSTGISRSGTSYQPRSRQDFVEHCMPKEFFPAGDWSTCVEAAADHFYDQPESVEIVVTAAFATCYSYEIAYRHAWANECGIDWSEDAKKEWIAPKIIARVMAARAALARAKRLPRKAPRPAIGDNRM
jgi:hypothetical protein